MQRYLCRRQDSKLVVLDKARAEPGVYPGKHWRFSKLDRKVADR